MAGSNSGGGANNNPSQPSSLINQLKNCQGCQQRKEYVKEMLGSTNFWVGVAVGVGGVWAYHKWAKK